MDDKVYVQEIVNETPFPGDSLILPQSPTPNGQSGNYTPSKVTDRLFPIKRTSVELLSQALNTRSKKVLQEFELQDSGGFRIGKFREGISGDVSLTPNGLVARNLAGLTTFVLDGDTGDATFKGTVQAEDFVIADENGLVSASVFQSDSYRDDDVVTINLTFSGTLVAGSELSFTLVRPAKVLITFFANVTIDIIDSLQNYYIKVGASIDNSNPFAVGADYAQFETEGIGTGVMGSCLSFAKTYLLDAGQHTISMKWAALSDTNVHLNSRGLDYCMLGS